AEIVYSRLSDLRRSGSLCHQITKTTSDCDKLAFCGRINGFQDISSLLNSSTCDAYERSTSFWWMSQTDLDEQFVKQQFKHYLSLHPDNLTVIQNYTTYLEKRDEFAE